ncbi:hypothetical protein BDQ17DRAFT_1404521 [Cyathus striatus]|nr:hypothetical protein BDQ17DRAFT_1404521 [Cyathus striatus]
MAINHTRHQILHVNICLNSDSAQRLVLPLSPSQATLVHKSQLAQIKHTILRLTRLCMVKKVI